VKKSGNAEGRNGSGAQIIEHRAKRAKHHWRNDRGHRRKPIPKFAQSFNAALRRVAGDQRRLDGAEIDTPAIQSGTIPASANPSYTAPW